MTEKEIKGKHYNHEIEKNEHMKKLMNGISWAFILKGNATFQSLQSCVLCLIQIVSKTP